jgi:hypothetical protein
MWELWNALKERAFQIGLKMNVDNNALGVNTNNNEKQSNFPPYLPHCFRVGRDESVRV